MEQIQVFRVHFALHNFLIKLLKEDYQHTMDEIAILEAKDHNKNSIITNLACYLEIPPSSMTAKVDELVSKKLVERIRSDQKRRIIYLKLTPLGKRQLNKIRLDFKKYLVLSKV